MAEAIQQAAVVRVRDLTPHVREIVLSPLERRISYRPGQWISVKVPIDQKPALNRAYSMAEPEEETGHLTLVFDRVPGGIGSAYLYSLNPGDRVSFSGPHGKFVLPEQHDKGFLMIGRYTGIVPIRCMIRAMMSHDTATSLTIISTASSEKELLYHEELGMFATAHADFHYFPIVAPPELEMDRVLELVSKRLADCRDVVPMICGIKQFVRPLRAFLMDQGFDRRDVKVETYD
jgi:phenol hydroxylase P5 protein